MNKQEFIKALADNSGFTIKDAGVFVDAFQDTVLQVLKKDDDIVLSGFGKFYVKKSAAKMGTNPKTGEKIKIAASKSPAFKAAKGAKEAL